MKQQAERGLGPVSAFTLAIGMMSATSLALAQESAPAPAPAAAAPAEAATPDLAPAAPAPAAAASAKAVNLEKIEVTGSRIRRVEAESIQQVVTINRAAIVSSGVTTVGDLIQELPSIAGQGNNPRVNNGGGDGSATISLRGLGTNRTLILLNGRRLVQQDVNSIPINLIERVEVLKDGASAVYGSDAIGGVVNFITRKDFKSFELSADYGISGESDGERRGLGISWGTATDKASIMIGLNYNQQDAVSAADRTFSSFATYLSSGSVIKAGSSRNPRGRITLDRATTGAQYNCAGTGATVTVSRIAGTTGANQSDYQCYSAARDAFNFQAVGNVVLTPQERSGIFTVANYKFSDSVEGYTEFFVNSTRSSYIIAPLPFDARSDDTVVSASNGYNPFGVDFGGIDAVNGNLVNRFSALGNRTSNFQTDVGQINLGLRGDLSAITALPKLADWTWDAGIGYGRIEQQVNRVGYIFGPALKAALGPTFVRADSSLGCGTSAATEIAGCTPINIFNLTDAAQIAALQSVGANAGSTLNNVLKTATFNIAGDLLPLPAGALSIALGAEYREERQTNEVDFLARSLAPNFDTCYLSQETCSNPVNGQFHVTEFYGETLVPVVKDLAFAKQLNLIAGVRFSDYSNFGTTTNAKIGMEYRPVDDLLIRTNYAKVFRAPTIADLFTPATISNPQFSDPCVGTTQAVGVDANFDKTCENVARDGSYSPLTSQVSATISGNPNLDPETGTVLTYGFVYDPSFDDRLKGLSLSVDFWRYRLKDTIETLDPNTVGNQCLSTGNDAFCDLIVRAPDGQVLNFGLPTFNLGKVNTSGIDTSVKYRSPKFEFGRVNAGIDVTYLQKYNRIADPTNPSSVTGNAGRYNNQDGNFSRVRGVGTVGWTNWDIEANLSTRYIGEYEIGEADVSKGASADGSIPGVVLGFGGTWYYDATLGYKYKRTNTKFLVGIDNISDEKPPFQYQNNSLNANTDPNTFDTVGRYFFFKLTQSF